MVATLKELVGELRTALTEQRATIVWLEERVREPEARVGR